MRLLRRVTQVVVKAAHARISPMDDAFDGGESFRFAGKRCRFGEPREKPPLVVQWRLKAVERGAAADRDRAVALDAQLLANALKERFRENVDSLPPLERGTYLRLVQDPRRVRERLARFTASRHAQTFEHPLLNRRLVQQPAAHVRVIVGA